MRTGKCFHKIAVWAMAACALVGMAGCYDDTGIRALLEDQERRLAALDLECARMNTNISSLQSILTALQKNDYISSFAPIMEGGKVVGYTLSFVQSGTVTIYQGKDGANGRDGSDGRNGENGSDGRDGTDGTVPVIGVAQDDDGCWYWTLNGAWLLDDAGNRVKAVGSDGQDGKDGKDGQNGIDGQDGIDGRDGRDGREGVPGKDGKNGHNGVTPMFKIENGFWYLSLNGGSTWELVGKATGEDGKNGKDAKDGKDGKDAKDGKDGKDAKDGKDGQNGDSMFKSVTEDAENVYITLSDNTVLTIPKVFPLDISFSADEGFVNDTLVLPTPMYDLMELHYKVSSPTEDAVVQVVTSADMDAYVVPDPQKPLEGIIHIKTHDTIKWDKESDQLLTKVLVIVANKTCSIMRTLVVQEAVLKRITTDRVDIQRAGGQLDFHYQTNTPISISVPDSAKTWCWQVKTKAAMADSIVSVHIEPNDGKRRRTSVTVSNHFGVGTPSAALTFYIYQEGNNEPIVFADGSLKELLLNNPAVNVNGDNEITMDEAAAVKTLEQALGQYAYSAAIYSSFDEFQYFTGIDTLKDGAFMHWRQLKSITLPESLKAILGGYSGCFGFLSYCDKLTTINGKFSVDSKAVVYNHKLMRVAPVTTEDEYTIPTEGDNRVDIIATRAFYGSGYKKVNLSPYVTKIRDRAFEHSKIESFTFPMTTDDPETGTAYVDSIAENSFIRCYYLKQFNGAFNHGEVRVTRDGLGLYRDTTFYAYALAADAQRFAIPEGLGIKRVSESIFDMRNDNGERMETLKLQAFGVPSTFEVIQPYAFRWVTNNLHIYFRTEKAPRVVGVYSFHDAPNVVIEVPAVMEGGEVNSLKSNERISEFEESLTRTNNAPQFKGQIAYYRPDDWPFNEDYIFFQDADLKAKLIENGVDKNQDGEISYYEASVVTSLEAMLGDSLSDAEFTSFDEFQYFLGITTLPAGSFNNWTKLTSITLPRNLETIAVDFKDKADAAPSQQTVFRNCPALASIKGRFTTPDGKALIYKQKGASTSKLVKVVEDIGSKEEITLPEGIDTIARYAFYGSRYKKVTLPNSLKVIGESAFEYSMIETLDLPLGGNSDPDKDTCRVTTVYDNTFAHCFSLKVIRGAKKHGQLQVCADNRLLWRDTTAYAYALGSTEKKLIIPDGTINGHINRLTDHLLDVVGGKSDYTGKSSLEVIALPSTLNDIGERTFYGCTSVKNLYFHGSTAPAKCGWNAFGAINFADMCFCIPVAADVDKFVEALHLDPKAVKFSTWDQWNP